MICLARGFGLWAAALAAALLGAPLSAQTWAQGAASFIETKGASPVPAAGYRLPWPQSARLSGPTDRYSHDVLGGIPRWTDLGLRAQPCATCDQAATGQTIRLPETLVFEDTGPRLWDVTGDATPEIVVVESDLRKGARLTVWSYDTNLTRIAVTPHIGRANRWLAPLGVGDFNADGQPDIAYVDRPHLARELVIVTVKGKRLVELARMGGVTNHRIGESVISGGVRNCGQGAEAILANADWSEVMAVRMDGARLVARSLGPLARNSFSRALACR